MTTFAPVTTLVGVATPLPLANIDTDVIIRIERVTVGDPAAIGHWAFEGLRYRTDGSEDPEFVLNRAPYRHAPILLAGPNFGCGSSREAAVTALLATGIRCVVAAEFGDIFYANCFQNGLLPVRLPEAMVLELMRQADGRPFTVDLAEQSVTPPDGTGLRFDIDPRRRDALLAGLDDIGQTLNDAEVVSRWQQRDRDTRPWIWNVEEVA